MRRTIVLLASCAGASLAFTTTVAPAVGLRSTRAGLVCSMSADDASTAAISAASRRSFLSLAAVTAAGVVSNPKNAFAGAPAVIEDLDEVDEEEDAEFQAKAKAAFKKQQEKEEAELRKSPQALRPVSDDDKPEPKKSEEVSDWKAGIAKSLQQGKEISKLRKNRNEMCEVLGRGC